MAQVSDHCVHTFVLTSKSITNPQDFRTAFGPLRTNSRSQLRIPLRSRSLLGVQALWTSSQDIGSSPDPFGLTFGPPAKRIPMRGARFWTSSEDFWIPFGPFRTHFRTHLRTPCEANPYEGCKILEFFERLSDPPSDPPSDPFRSESLLGLQVFGLSDPITRLDL